MTRWSPWIVLPCALALAGCDLAGLLSADPPNCDPRTAYWPDDDGDGVGDAHTVFIGCEAPAGWVTTPPPEAALPPSVQPAPADSDLREPEPADHDLDTALTDTAPEAL